jgi:hypothetical protein
MQLIKIDPVQAQPAQAAFAGGSQVFRLSIFNLLVGTRPHKAALRGDHQLFRVRMERLSYDFFTHAETVRVRGVDEIDSQVDSAPQNPDGLSPICWLAPNSVSRDSHRAEPQARNAKIASDQEFAGLLGERFVSLHCELVILAFCIRIPLQRWIDVLVSSSFGVTRPKRPRKKKHVPLTSASDPTARNGHLLV